MHLRDEDPDIALHRGAGRAADPARGARLPDDVLVRAYREMLRLRLLGARMAMLQRQGRVGAHVGSAGRETVTVATALALQNGDEADWVFPGPGAHGILLARGFPLAAVVAQAFGNEADVLRGRQLPGRPSSRRQHQASGSSRAGAQLPQAVGAAWAMRARRASSAVVAFLEEETTGEGDFHAAMNLAGVWRAPCVFVLASAGDSRADRAGTRSASRTFAVKARAYGFPGVRVDRGDFHAVFEVLSDALARARAGEGATLVEAAAGEPDADGLDPLERLRRTLEPRGLVTPAADEALRRDLTAEIAAAIDDVERLPPPDSGTLFADVYAEAPWHLREQLGSLKNIVAPST